MDHHRDAFLQHMAYCDVIVAASLVAMCQVVRVALFS